MQRDDETPSPDLHHRDRRRPWGCSVAVFILALVALFLVWDWYPVWSLNSRYEKLRQIAQPGKLWTEIEPLLAKENFVVAPAGLTAKFDEDPKTSKHVIVSSREPLLLQPAMSIAVKLSRFDAAGYVIGFPLRRLAVIRLDDEGHVESLMNAFI